MKTLKSLKLVLAITLIFTYFNCTTENDIHLNENTTNTQKIDSDVKPISCTALNTRVIFIEYAFESSSSLGQEIERTAYENMMSNYFTICSIQSTSCSHVDRWTVDSSEYQNYVNNPPQGTGTGNNTVDEGPGEIDNNSTHPCFTILIQN